MESMDELKRVVVFWDSNKAAAVHYKDLSVPSDLQPQMPPVMCRKVAVLLVHANHSMILTRS